MNELQSWIDKANESLQLLDEEWREYSVIPKEQQDKFRSHDYKKYDDKIRTLIGDLTNAIDVIQNANFVDDVIEEVDMPDDEFRAWFNEDVEM